MYSNKPPPPSYPEKLILALLGKKMESKNFIGNMILHNNVFVARSNSLYVAENNLFKIINACDFFDEKIQPPDQQIIDFMAVSQPGPNLFILVIDSENVQEEKVVGYINKLQNIFGEGFTSHLVVMLQDLRSFQLLCHVGERFNIQLVIANENLTSECRRMCLGRQPFLYSEADVTVGRTNIEMRRYDNVPPSTGMNTNSVIDNIFNIVLLGLTGTGKSASANTILALEKLDPPQLFKSEASSIPITTKCEVKIMQQLFGIQVRVVDTPDFFHEELKISQAQIEECRNYCRPGRGVILLVIQLGRFTDGEIRILEKLEEKMGWKIRENTIILLTHGEELKGSLQEIIEGHEHFKNIFELCGRRCHLFNNNSKDPKQVKELIKKIPNYEMVFSKNRPKNPCCVS